jgi:hypothetical protein
VAQVFRSPFRWESPVAETWGIHVTTYRGRENGSYGWAIPGRSIGLGVANLSTWAHELVHQAEHRLGTLTVGNGQDRENEIVAELGGAVLLTLLGQQAAAGWGGAYRYICSYARARDGEGLHKEVMRLTNRMAGAVRLILDEAGHTKQDTGMRIVTPHSHQAWYNRVGSNGLGLPRFCGHRVKGQLPASRSLQG